MKIVEKGHIYHLNNIDVDPHRDTPHQRLYFVNREQDCNHAGTQTQEVLRALIDRTIHCDNCLRWDGNDKIVYHLRMALVLHEARALERKVEKGLLKPEHVEVDNDGHFLLERSDSGFEPWRAEREKGQYKP